MTLEPISSTVLANIDLQPSEFVVNCPNCFMPVMVNLDSLEDGVEDWSARCPECGYNTTITIDKTSGYVTVNLE